MAALRRHVVWVGAVADLATTHCHCLGSTSPGGTDGGDTDIQPTRALTATVLAAVLTVGAAVPSAAQDPNHKRDQTNRQRDAVRQQLDLARASDADVEAEVARLDKEVAVQDARAATARQAERAAQTEVSEATRRLRETEARASAARQLMAKRAVDAYVHPGGQDALIAIVGTRSLDEAQRRQAMLSVVQSGTADAIGVLRAVREDQSDAASALEAARRQAAERAAAESRAATSLASARDVQRSAADQLQGRIRDLQEEGRVLDAQEAELSALLRARAARPEPPPPARPGPAPAAGQAQGPPRASAGGFIWPTRGSVTSEFGPRWGSFHKGIDIAAPEGTPIVAAKAGTVVLAGSSGGYGLLVVIDHGGGMATAYAHQSRLAASNGQGVSQGQTIGYVGNTGQSTGNHLHFEVRVNGSAQNPRGYLGG